MPALHVQMLPQFLAGQPLQETITVVIDVLRASTTMIHALAHGASSIIPCLTVEEAQQTASRLPTDSRLLGGERHGRLIPGFDLGNSPLDYTLERVQGKTLVFTTTNGTRALLECRTAARVAIGAFVNRQAIVDLLSKEGRDVHLVCAGTDGQLTAEDILFAGAVASDLLSLDPSPWVAGNVQAQMAADYFQARSRSREQFCEAFSSSRGATNLIELGMTRDIDRCLEENLFSCVPCWEARTGMVQLN